MTSPHECSNCGHAWGVHEQGEGCAGTSTGTINGKPCRCKSPTRTRQAIESHNMEQEHILNTHIDTLTEWWDEATPGIPKTGDTYIEDERHRGSSFRIVEAATDHKYGFENIRILHRAPAPTPAWHDAVAVIAKGQEEWDHREAFTRSDDYPETRWVCNQGVTFKSEDLRDAAPLIEQKVTDEAATRVLEYLDGFGIHKGQVIGREIVAAALGLDPA